MEEVESFGGADVYDSRYALFWLIFKSECYTDLKCGRVYAGIENQVD